jgi:hypothetical protein
MPIEQLVIVYGGELAKDVAEQVATKKPEGYSIEVAIRCADHRPKTLPDMGAEVVVCFILQTIENASPTEDASGRTFQPPFVPCPVIVVSPYFLFSSYRVVPVSDSSRESRTPKRCLRMHFPTQSWVWATRTCYWTAKQLGQTTAIKLHKNSMHALPLSVESVTTLWAWPTREQD